MDRRIYINDLKIKPDDFCNHRNCTQQNAQPEDLHFRLVRF